MSSSSESSESSSGIFATGFATNTGRVRSENEDRAFADCWLLIVADGMGGHQAGEVASEITVSTIRNACSPAPLGADDSNLAHPHLFTEAKLTKLPTGRAVERLYLKITPHRGLIEIQGAVAFQGFCESCRHPFRGKSTAIETRLQ